MSLLITNKVLSLLGSEPVQSVNGSEWGIVINAVIPTFYYNLLQEHTWTFSSKFLTLNKNVINTNPLFENSFTLPSDFIRIREVYETDSYSTPLLRYTTDGTNLYTPFGDITIEYTSSTFDVDMTPESFKLALAYRLIANLNARLLNNTQLVQYYMRMDKEMFAKAVNLDNTNVGQLRQMVQPRRYL